ncbi:MAG: DUF4231 domain-containing protein [Rhodothermales bacterium]
METQKNPILEQAWKQFATYDGNAGRHQKLFHGLQLGILGLGVLAVLLALVQTQLFSASPDDDVQKQWGFRVLRYAIILAPILISILISATNRFKSGNKWIMLRAGAESLKREIYRYRARAGIYSDASTVEKSRDLKLADKLSLVTRQLMKTAVNEASVPPYEGDIPPKMYGAAADDDGFSPLTAQKYIDIRLGDQLKYFSGKTGSLEKKLKLLQVAIYVVGGLGTLLAAIGFELWVALTAALAAAFAAYLEYAQTENTLVLYNQVATNLNNTLTWWKALTPAERANPDQQSLLVEQTEQALADEHAGWVQQMTDALSELQEQQEATKERVKAEVEDVFVEAAALEARMEAARETDAIAEPEEPEAAEPEELEEFPEPEEGAFAEEEQETAEEITPEIAPPVSAPAPDPVSKTLTEADFIEVADNLGIELAAMKAVAEVEAGGSGFKGDKPKILFEGHIFWRRLNAHGIDPAPLLSGNENVLHKKWSRKYYREDQYARLEKARQINEDAALESASWGMFQIMGFHWESLGYASAKAFVDLMYKSEGEHLKAFAKFMKVNKLVRYLKNLNWAKFARGYNGPGYAANKYDIKMAEAYKKHKG